MTSALRDPLVDALRAPESASAAETRARIIQELAARPDANDALVATRIGVEATRAEYPIRALSLDTFKWSDAVCILLATGLLEDDDLDAIEPELEGQWRLFVQRQRALTRIVHGDVDGAVEIAERMPADRAFRVYRDIGWAAARAGDVELYHRFAAKYAPGKDRTAMDRLRGEFLAGVAEAHGLDAAVDAAGGKGLGTKYLTRTVDRLARSGDIEALDAAFAGSLADVVPPGGRLSYLMDAVAAASPRAPEHDHPRLAALLDEAIAIDPTESKAVMRGRDAILFASWPAIGDEETLKRVRAAVRTPDYRRQLTRLARDIR